jgi:hypothetical protein
MRNPMAVLDGGTATGLPLTFICILELPSVSRNCRAVLVGIV